MKVTVVGLGLIGGSIAKDLNNQINVSVVGVDNNIEHCKTAMSLNLVDETMDLEQAIKNTDVVVLAIPVDAIEGVISHVLDIIDDHTTVIDVGSTKEKICAKVNQHDNRKNFVAAHPLAGTEFSGPTAALSGLFLNKKNIICERESSGSNHLNTALDIFKSLGLTTYYLSPKEHDKHVAYVSHLSHISSFTLSQTVLDIEKDENQIFNLAGTGFESTVRLAKSSPHTWGPIFNKNSEHLVTALTQYIENLTQFKEALEQGDESTYFNIMKAANKIKAVLNN